MANHLMGVSRDFTPSDDPADNDNFDYVYATTAGSISVQLKGGVATLTSMPAGVWMPFNHGLRINATGTTATGLIVT